MNSSETLALLSAGRVVAIMRGDFRGQEEEIVAVLCEAGITAVELTLNSADAMNAIKQLAMRFGTQIAVGAGTVLRTEEVDQVADVGACFVVSPNRDVRVIEAAKRRHLISLPGCFTPSEIVEALAAGADAAKLFPANSLGPGFVRAMRGPLPHARLVPTGGVTPETAREYMLAGAWAVAVGSELVGPDALTDGGLGRLQTRAAAFVDAVRSAEGASR